ncbi:MAG: hypothetical protein IRY94_05980, partial [Rhodospirillaceae bacterium]|nr:hypothetical protein [Rhodospirillaceae bacterium]
MKIIEFGKEEREGPARRMKILEFDHGRAVERARPAPAAPRPAGEPAPAA